ncbi:MAG: UDP-N-acetylmuramate dehydrogenase [Burkholderiaceae bacterium]|jgi:UDP-N-acetylmuramate dehydrogenase|nr:UDP-N-acetylmuramate dehydrogenase [Burkholderiaceae bacterium]MDH5208110.1 UDP-N-acetylmuramate dehydrogenase [Burkholderiaceae bacterium]
MESQIQCAVSLRSFNTFGVEARAAFFAAVRSVDQLRDVLMDARVRDLPRLVLGGGSNVLFTKDFDGLVVKIDIPGYARAGEDDGRHLVHVGAGEAWHATVDRLLGDGLPGVENLALIPGSVGAAPIQNIGAYGIELAERLHSVQVFEPASGSVSSLDVEACRFGYRDSIFKQRPADGRIVVGVTLALPTHWVPVVGYADVEHELKRRDVSHPSARDVFDAVVAIRSRKLPDPQQVGNAGSFFKNPVVSRARRQELVDRFPSIVNYDIGGGRDKLAAGWLIEACGLKGAVRGRAGVYPRQALVLVNLGGATGAEILALAREVQDAVRARFGVELEPEPTVL